MIHCKLEQLHACVIQRTKDTVQNLDPFWMFALSSASRGHTMAAPECTSLSRKTWRGWGVAVNYISFVKTEETSPNLAVSFCCASHLTASSCAACQCFSVQWRNVMASPWLAQVIAKWSLGQRLESLSWNTKNEHNNPPPPSVGKCVYACIHI